MTCRKVKHSSTWGAAQHIMFMQRKQRSKTMGIYYCGKCDAYHITRKPDGRCIAKLK